MCMKKPMTTKEALRVFKKFRKWNSGEIDTWDKKNRVPPPMLLRRMYDTLGDALTIVNELGITKDMVFGDIYDVAKVYKGDHYIIEFAKSGSKFINTLF